MNFNIVKRYDLTKTIAEICKNTHWKNIIVNNSRESKHIVYFVRLYQRELGKFFYKIGYTEIAPNSTFVRLKSLNTEYNSCAGNLSTNIIVIGIIEASGKHDEKIIKKMFSSHFKKIPHRKKIGSYWTELSEVSHIFYNLFCEYAEKTYSDKFWKSSDYQISENGELFKNSNLSHSDPEL